MPEFRRVYLLLLSVLLPAVVQAQSWGTYPVMPPAVVQAVQEVKDQAQNDAASDPFRLFEQTEHAQIKDWLQRQNALTDNVITRIAGREFLLARLRGQMLSEVPTAPVTGTAAVIEDIETADSRIYAQTGADQRRRIIIQNRAVGAERVLFLTADNEQIQRVLPAPDMSKLGVLTQINNHGRTESSLSIIQISDGQLLDDRITLADAAESNAFWKADSKAVFYTRYADSRSNGATHVITEIAQHIVGEPVRIDKVIAGAGMAKPVRLSADDSVRMKILANAAIVLLEVTHTNGGGKSYFQAKQNEVTGGGTPWKLFATQTDKIDSLAISADAIYLLSRKKSMNGSLLKIDLKSDVKANVKADVKATQKNDLKADTKTLKLSQANPLVKEGATVLHELFATKNAVYWHASEAGVSQLRRVDANGGNISAIALPVQGRISELTQEPAPGVLSFVLESASVAPARYIIGQDGKLVSAMPAGTALQTAARVLSKTFYLPAASGERIPLTLIYHADLEMDGSHPALLVTDYTTPSLFVPGFDASRMAWLEQGGIVAIVQMRAAANSSDGKPSTSVKYSLSGNMNEQSTNVILAAEYLIREGYTSPAKLTAEEIESAKDVVIKAALRRPDLFAAVHLHNVRSEALPVATSEKVKSKNNRTTAGETGFAFDELRSGVAYPAMLISADATETGAPLWMSSKLAAGMQILSTNKNRPVLLRTSAKTSNTDTQSDLADAWAFLLWQAGVKKFSLSGGK